ncbi:hypothetical protein DFR70_12683 [Nocardia tenerifensis]|uniref:Uncharacterized protein n=1 Tax=Nocardia tenerifensis TaxID=228006 RepID=A0A318JMG5_9NOCA|nr:hypothetical protein [Nocardia tenerifensis]PXX53962.1 hypothetical protein DFR70_12683 [Nocardia tenerifensis]
MTHETETVPAKRDHLPPLPTTRELLDAMAGVIPERHPARSVLCAALMLARIDDYTNPDIVYTDDDYQYEGSVVLGEIGIADITTGGRAHLINCIDAAARRYGNPYGRVIDAVARAWWEYRLAARYFAEGLRPGDQTERAKVDAWLTNARRAVVVACADYRRLLRGRTWISGPPREGQSVVQGFRPMSPATDPDLIQAAATIKKALHERDIAAPAHEFDWMPPYTKNTLLRNGIRHMVDLAQKTDKQLLAIPGLGWTRVAELREGITKWTTAADPALLRKGRE